jgi:hypothetical protein
LPEGIDGIAGLHALVAEHLPEDWEELEPEQVQGLVKIGIKTDRGPWVAALVAAGYGVFAINPMSVARYRERHSTSGAKSDASSRGRNRMGMRSVPAADPAPGRSTSPSAHGGDAEVPAGRVGVSDPTSSGHDRW